MTSKGIEQVRVIIMNAEERTVSEDDIDGKLHSLRVGGLIAPVSQTGQ